MFYGKITGLKNNHKEELEEAMDEYDIVIAG